jgi:hypothetical protein
VIRLSLADRNFLMLCEFISNSFTMVSRRKW